MPRSLQQVLQECSGVLFPADLGERAVDIDTVGYDGDTPLHVMAWRNDVEAVRILIGAGADVNAKGEMDETPLHIAVHQENRAMIRALLEAGARDDIRSEFGDTPRERAGGDLLALFGGKK